MYLPDVLRLPLTSVIGDTCYTSLVENLNYQDVDCLKYSVSKGLGLGIVLGGSIVKVPQIMTIVSHGSAQGLSLSSYIIETLAYTITLAYNIRQHNPFSTFGEIMFITLQNLVIIGLIASYGKEAWKALPAFVLLGCTFYALQDASLLPWSIVQSCYAATIPLSLASKVPQILTNWRNGSTGRLSVFTVMNYFLGSAARVFTTMTELNDPLMLWGNLLATSLNFILVLQVALYWGNSTPKEKTA
ncbi:mannose-P-dolichol utilization defect 1 protein [Hesseltinella vesiculosa]|uniref:Mannose-P-dolichol utilization defect 1 protein homolog n=1 Tax=Hesseltinella vesiculosa TaxID=101127 RepID=A0A1X2GQM9_9FUNG|nr:mannose-P-dolichol utilization defect 1 protein [Hesseltinella vesiculosa]